MNKRVKWVIGGIVFLGLDGAVIPNLESSLNLLRSLDWLGSGGAFKSTREIKVNHKQLGVDRDLLTAFFWINAWSEDAEICRTQIWKQTISRLKRFGLSQRQKQWLYQFN
ncbi:hypothetical protein DNK47_03010 [Mycoplasma wenyonii]|uniref:Uncharacterized protein n=1 Tax=Mycoplasma wenyonii TaxID=65123 RepID=A0A328PIB8_9MOLU|nr:hypothetical protein DNK47_03010 [Mycoplasma wenyonii]